MQSPICFSGLVQVCYSQILIYPLPNIIRWGCNHPNWGLAALVPGMKTFTVWEALWEALWTYRASTHHLHPSSVSSEEALDSALWVQECRKQRWIYVVTNALILDPCCVISRTTFAEVAKFASRPIQIFFKNARFTIRMPL